MGHPRIVPSPQRPRVSARCRSRRVCVFAGVALALWLIAPAPIAARAADDEGRGANAVGDALGLRLGLLGFVGVVLVGGAYAQYHSLATLRRGRPSTGRAGQVVASDAAARPRLSGVPRAAVADTTPGAERVPTKPVPPTRPAAPRNLAVLRPAEPAERSSPAARSPQEVGPRDLAEQDCVRAIAAACRYDRHTTLAAFRSALTRNPEVKPSSLSGFWDMPAGGHADLARAYLQCGQHVDARSILTVAMMLSPHNRELEALEREANPQARPAYALRSQG